MDIRNWPMDQIMQLPDCCFGRRFVISCTGLASSGGVTWDMSEVAFPERSVIWEVAVWGNARFPDIHSIRLAIGDQLPTTRTMMSDLESLFFGLGEQGPDPRVIIGTFGGFLILRRLRMPLKPSGRRLVLEVSAVEAKDSECTVCVVVSSMPKEVPDWLFSDQVRSLL